MPNPFNNDWINWKNTVSVILGLLLGVVMLVLLLVLPAYIEYSNQAELRMQNLNMYGSYLVYTGFCCILFFLTIRLRLWFSKDGTLIKNSLAISILINLMVWVLIVIASL